MITPLEIQNHKFNTKMRGFAPEEVRHFLYALSEEFENLTEQNHNMARELAVLRARVKDIESRDKVLKDTLITAQQIKSDISTNAEKEADLIVKEGQLKADRLYEDARREVTEVRRKAGDLRRMRNDLLAEAELMVARFNHFIEAEREEASESDKVHQFTPKTKEAKPRAAAPEKSAEPRIKKVRRS